MPRITHVKAAQQRFKTVPVLDDNGDPMYRITQRKRPTKRGKTEIRTRVTKADKTQPLPPLRCDYPDCQHPDRQILPGQPYKWMKPKSGPYGGQQRNRHEEHPNWHQWEYSDSLSARIAYIQHEFQQAIGDDWDDPEPIRDALSAAAESIRELAEEKNDAASNMEDGFGHPTSQSDDLRDTADTLDYWASEVESADVPDLPDPQDADPVDFEDCETCDGTGFVTDADDNTVNCDDCDGSGSVAPDEPTESQMDYWRSEVEDAIVVVEESPL